MLKTRLENSATASNSRLTFLDLQRCRCLHIRLDPEPAKPSPPKKVGIWPFVRGPAEMYGGESLKSIYPHLNFELPRNQDIFH